MKSMNEWIKQCKNPIEWSFLNEWKTLNGTVQVILTHKSNFAKNVSPPWVGGENEKANAIRRILARGNLWRGLFEKYGEMKN